MMSAEKEQTLQVKSDEKEATKPQSAALLERCGTPETL